MKSVNRSWWCSGQSNCTKTCPYWRRNIHSFPIFSPLHFWIPTKTIWSKPDCTVWLFLTRLSLPLSLCLAFPVSPPSKMLPWRWSACLELREWNQGECTLAHNRRCGWVAFGNLQIWSISLSFCEDDSPSTANPLCSRGFRGPFCPTADECPHPLLKPKERFCRLRICLQFIRQEEAIPHPEPSTLFYLLSPSVSKSNL